MPSLERVVTMTQVINNILHYGYSPDCHRRGLPKEIAESARATPHTGPYERLLELTVDAFRDVIDDELQEIPNDATHVVPLSAGLDSRAILATLLDHPDVSLEDVDTVTFGTPGTWDYEIGQRVAEVAGVKNETIDLTVESFDWSLDALREYARTRGCPGGIFTGYANAAISRVIPQDGVIWAGFIGGPTAGGHQPAEPSDSWEGACAYFAEHEQYASGLTAPNFDPQATLPEEPFISRKRLSFEEQLDFALRQQCAIAPVVIGSGTYRFPFTHPKWLEVSLNLPARHRRGRTLFIDAFVDAFPELFALPTDANAGLSPSASRRKQKAKRAGLRGWQGVSSRLGFDVVHPATNYIDFESAFRSGQLQNVTKELLDSFADRDIVDWVDPQQVWNKHQAGTNRAREIQVLCATELYLSESQATAETHLGGPSVRRKGK